MSEVNIVNLPILNPSILRGLKIKEIDKNMADIIQLLPDSIANQIAAGEVIQRPASAVKELLENAIDAGASSVKLILKDAGKTLIQVIDDGCGMSETDARMSFERHATSKIRTSDDLFNIRTMDFGARLWLRLLPSHKWSCGHADGQKNWVQKSS